MLRKKNANRVVLSAVGEKDHIFTELSYHHNFYCKERCMCR